MGLARLVPTWRLTVPKFARTALITLAVVVGLLVVMHVVAPSWMASVAHHIHGR